MIKLLLILLVGIGLGYTYGYMHGAEGDASLITSALEKVGVHHAVGGVESAVIAANRDEARRQAKIDSLKQARIDSITSLGHH
jgi:hypothetical protein